MAETIPIPSRGEIKKLLVAKLNAWKEQKFAGGFTLPSALRVAHTDRRLMAPAAGAESTANWFYTYTSLESTECLEVPQLASGVRTDTCLVDVMRNDSSVFVTCDASTNSVTIIAYNNTMCNPASNDYMNITAPLGCVPPDAADITDEGDVLSYLNGCTFDSGNHSSASPYPLPEGGNYATFSFYDDSFCAAALSFQGLLNGACLPANEHASIRVQYPDVVYFALSPSCQGPSTTVAKVFDESCTMNDDHLFIGDDGGADDSTDDALALSFEYRRASLYGNAPTPSPVVAPTRAPEELGWVVSFVSPGDTCSKSAPFARGYATNACMAAGNLQSVMYSCREQGVMKTVFDSVDCDPDTVANYVRIPKGCFTEFDEGMEMDVAAEYMCKTGDAEIVLPNDDDYAVYEYYDQAGCATLLHYSAIKNKNCIGLNGKSLYVDYPNQFAFPESEHCTGTNSSRMAYIQTCTGGYFGEVMGPQARQRILEAKLDDVASPTFTYKWSSLTAGPASASSSSSSTTLSTGAIAGIAVGGVALVVAVAVALYFLVFAAAASTKAPSAPPSAVEIPETDNDKKKILEGERSDA